MNNFFDTRDLLDNKSFLRLAKSIPGDPFKGLVPFHHFKIKNSDDRIVGHINFKIGDSNHVILTAGHIGFEVLPDFRGHSYAYKACLALQPFVLKYYAKVILTAAPDYLYSIRVFEKLRAKYIDEVAVATEDPAYRSGARKKVRYEWTL